MNEKERLVEILRERSVRTGRFVLASGRVSDLYVDARQTTLHPEGAALIGKLVLARLGPEIAAVGGPVTGAIPIVGSVVALSWLRGRPVQGFMVRKQAKGHGMGQWLEGGLPEGSTVCMVEDTVTTGGSLIEAIQRVEEAGHRVVQSIAVVDRQEGAEQAMAAAGYALEALVTRADLV